MNNIRRNSPCPWKSKKSIKDAAAAARKKRLQPLLHHVLARCMTGLKRCIFRGRTPRWAEDAYNIVSYANFVRLVPTFVGLLVAPRHFFRRLPQIHKGQTSLYVTPAYYLWDSLVFTVTMALLVYANVPGADRFIHDYIPEWAKIWPVMYEWWLVFLLLLLFCFLSLLLIVPTSWMLRGIYRLTDSALRNAGDLQTTYKMSMPVSDHTLFSIPLSREVYRHIDRAKFTYGLCYFGITSFLMFLIVGMAAVASFYVFILFQFTSGMPWLPAFVLVPYLLLPAALGKRLLVQPYVELLRAAQRTPSSQIQFGDLESIQFTVDLLVAELVDLMKIEGYQSNFGVDGYSTTQERKSHLEKERKERIGDINRTALGFYHVFSRLLSLWRIQDFDLRNEPYVIRAAFVAARRRACRTKLQCKLSEVKELLGQTSVDENTAALIHGIISKLEAKLTMPCLRKHPMR